MKTRIDPLEPTFKSCMITGKYKEKQLDRELVKSLVFVSERGLAFINARVKDIPKESTDWTFVFRDYYESMRGLIEAYLLQDGIEADHHQCKNAYICHKHPELELDWEFLETVRLLRNAINYRGLLITFDDWKKFQLKFDLTMKHLSKEVKKRM